MKYGAAALLLLALLGGCSEDELELVTPDAVEPNMTSTGRYCGMAILDHHGPKGQIFIEGASEPFWFSSARDAVAFTMLPDEPKRIAAIYVNDMARADWERPQPGTWIDARSATYVIGSSRLGGMGAAETVPFGDAEAAWQFVSKFGGEVVAFGEIPREAVLGSGSAPPATPGPDTAQVSP